jgi:hypothetical protein
MWALDLSVTGNQNSIPRELVYDVDGPRRPGGVQVV